MYSWRRLFRFAFYLSTLLLQSVLLPPAEVLQPAVGPEQWWFPTATMLQEAAAEPTRHFTAASVLPSVLHDPQQDYLRHFLKDVEQLMSATCAPIPDQPHISKHRLLHAVIALSSFTSSLADPRGFQPRTKNWLSEDPLSEPLTWDMIQSWLEITAMCIAVMSAASSMLLSYCGLQVDVTFHQFATVCYVALLLSMFSYPTYDSVVAALVLLPFYGMPALAMFVTFLEALLLAVCHVMLAMHYVDGLVKQVLEYAMLGVVLGFHLMYLLRQNKTCPVSSATTVSLWTRLQGLLWCASNYDSDLEALVSIFVMVAIAMYSCPFLSPSLLAILLMIGGVELNPGPDFNILAIIVMMIASPRIACSGQEATGQRSLLVVFSQFHALTNTALMLHALQLLCLAVATMTGTHRRGPVSTSATAGELVALSSSPEAESCGLPLMVFCNYLKYASCS